MAYLQITNRASSTLAASIVAADVSLSVAAGGGALFPASNFAITIENERILVGTRTIDAFTSLTRGYDGTVAADHASGTAVELRVIAKHITELQTGKQDLDATLTSLAALGTAADKIAYTTGVDTWAEAAITAIGRLALTGSLPKFSAHKDGTNQTGIVTGTWTKITFTTEEYDVGSAYDAANSKWVPGIIGKGHIDATIHWTTMPDQGEMHLTVYKNGVLYKRVQNFASVADSFSHHISCDVLVDAVTDYFEVYALQNSGTDKIISGSINLATFNGHMLL